MVTKTLLALTLASIMAFAALSGCLDEATKKAPGPTGAPDLGLNRTAVYDAVKALLTDVKCEAPFDAAKTTANLKTLATLKAKSEDKEFGARELDIRGDIAAATLGGFGGIGLFNISNPLQPVQLSMLNVKGEYDVKFAPSNDTVFVGVSGGISIVDVRNLTNPVQTSLWAWSEAPQPPRGVPLQNAHMLYTARIASQDWLFLAPNSNTGVWIFKITGEAGAKKLTFVTNTLPLEGGPLGPHDMYVQYDMDLKKWVLYSADGFHGWTAFDVSDPSKPMPIGGIVKPEPGYTHTIQAAKIGGRRIVVTIQEVGVNVMEIYDATVLAAPVLLGTWQHDVAATSPQHNFNIVGGRLYMAHYNSGLFVFDLNKLNPTPQPTVIQPVAHYGPQGESHVVPLGGFGQFYDVVVKDGVVYGASYGGASLGIHVIGYGCLAPGDEKLTSDG